MSAGISSVLLGATAMASFVAMLLFFRFWHQMRDGLFGLFGLAFGLDAITRLALGAVRPGLEVEPLFYFSRLISFLLIIAAIIGKNLPHRKK